MQPEPAWCLRYAPGTNLAFAFSGATSQGAVLGVELEKLLQRGSRIQISQRIGSTANRVGGGFSPPPPTPPSMRVRTGRFTSDS